MSKKERKARRQEKRRSWTTTKVGARSKPTMVKTDRKVRKEDMDINEQRTKRVRVLEPRMACYHKVKSRYTCILLPRASGGTGSVAKVGA